MRGLLQWAWVGGLSLVAACSGTTLDSEGTGGRGQATGGRGQEACVTGDERCDCYPNDTCNDNLICASGLCVRLPTTGGGAGAAAGGTGSGGEPSGGAGTGGIDQPGSGGAQGGGGAAAASCDRSVTPCGGDVVGTWQVTSSCLTVSGTMDVTPLGMGCTSLQITEGSLKVTGTWTNDANRTYTDDTLVTGTETLEMPGECLQISGTIITCDAIVVPIGAGLGYAELTCVDNDATGGCTCRGKVDQRGGLGVAPMVYPYATGNFTVADNTITVTPDEQEYSYCVAGTTLVVTPKSVGTTGTVTGTIVLEKE